MLAAGSAWRILEAEHVQLRQLLAAIDRVLSGGDAWKHGGPQLNLLRHRIRAFQDFEVGTHRPKGVVLLGSVRGRSAEADQLLDVLDHESQLCEQLLAQVLELLDKIEQGGGGEAGEVASLLNQHRELMLGQLDREDTALRSYTAQLLTSDEWSSVASSISREVQKARRRTPAKD
ncbi:hemerythrin domain-containing protein [Ramlibacter henchirensis]|uniref:Hemerythrin domain-containing protein n=1 Tax=Ramlibacter henchirensis TaxID=204072 RepID=A0A4Z0CAL6_9BURK|nr:hemerythrin domain-containing protein [Ramlibacter henchirensis]